VPTFGGLACRSVTRHAARCSNEATDGAEQRCPQRQRVILGLKTYEGAPEATMAKRVPTPDEIRAWPATVDVPTAGRAFGIGRDEAYRLVREGHFPVHVLRLGRYLRVTRAAVLDALGISDQPPSQPHTPRNNASAP
jgi:hypothetical protein